MLYDYVIFTIKYEFIAEDEEGEFRDWDYESITLEHRDVCDFDDEMWEYEKDYWMSIVENSEEFEKLNAIKILDIDLYECGWY